MPAETIWRWCIALVALAPGALADPSPAEQAAMMETLGRSIDRTGHTVNDCTEAIVPQFLPVDLGAAGAATLVVIPGGPNTPECYGDGPDLHLMLHQGATFREIFAMRGGRLAVLPGATKGMRDLAQVGPGAAWPVWRWDGKTYVASGRTVASSTKGAVTLP